MLSIIDLDFCCYVTNLWRGRFYSQALFPLLLPSHFPYSTLHNRVNHNWSGRRSRLHLLRSRKFSNVYTFPLLLGQINRRTLPEYKAYGIHR